MKHSLLKKVAVLVFILTVTIPGHARFQGITPSDFDTLQGYVPLVPSKIESDASILSYIDTLAPKRLISQQQRENGVMVAKWASQRDLPWKKLTAISFCESSFYETAKNDKNGHGNGIDYGIFQVNSKYHPHHEKIDDQIEYGLDLYEKEGDNPWRYSKHCWEKFI